MQPARAWRTSEIRPCSFSERYTKGPGLRRHGGLARASFDEGADVEGCATIPARFEVAVSAFDEPFKPADACNEFRRHVHDDSPRSDRA